MIKHTIGIISDTHYGEHDQGFPWEAIKQSFKGVELILHAGDIVSEEIISCLSEIAPVEAVYGNMDPTYLRIKLKLQENKIIKIGGINIGLVHGFGLFTNINDKYKYYFPKKNVQVMVFGHTHKISNYLENDVLFFNPGSPYKPFHQNKPSVGKLTISESGKVKGYILLI